MYFADHKAAVPADSAALPHLKRLRTGRDLTQEQLAEKINVSRTYIVKIENGVQIGPIEIAIELAMFYGRLCLEKQKHAHQSSCAAEIVECRKENIYEPQYQLLWDRHPTQKAPGMRYFHRKRTEKNRRTDRCGQRC